MTKLVKNQTKRYGPVEYHVDGQRHRITATVRHDDRCGNGHNTFSITGEIDVFSGGKWREEAFGCLHNDISIHFPELAPLIKWHLTSTDGPMHYIANTCYHAGDRDCWGHPGMKERNLDAARECAVWPEATKEDLTAPGIELRLQARLPALMADFRRAVESLGFTY